LHAASAALNEHANQIIAVNDAALNGRRPSSVGAASVSAAIAAFSSAYAVRVANLGSSVEAAAERYTGVDDGAATDIDGVSA
jgi:hypothetical protein